MVSDKDKEKEKTQVAKTILIVVEFVDDLVPIVGKFMDLDVVDKIQERIVQDIVSNVLDHVDNTEDPIPWSA